MLISSIQHTHEPRIMTLSVLIMLSVTLRGWSACILKFRNMALENASVVRSDRVVIRGSCVGIWRYYEILSHSDHSTTIQYLCHIASMSSPKNGVYCKQPGFLKPEVHNFQLFGLV